MTLTNGLRIVKGPEGWTLLAINGRAIAHAADKALLLDYAKDCA